jgi:transposase, IS5 family
MSQPRDDRQDDLFRPTLEKIIDLRHPLVRLAGTIDWDFLARHFSSACRVGPGQPPLPTRPVAGCSFSSTCTISPTRCCATMGGEPVLPILLWRGGVPPRGALRSFVVDPRQRLGEEHITALLQEGLSVAHRTGAIEIKDLERVAVDTTVQEIHGMRVAPHHDGGALGEPADSSAAASSRLAS